MPSGGDGFLDLRKLDGHQVWLQAELFRIAFWRVRLNLFGGGECGSWPQLQIGMVLWLLSTMGHRWQPTLKLIKLGVLPDEAVLRNPEFVAPTLFVWRVHRPWPRSAALSSDIRKWT